MALENTPRAKEILFQAADGGCIEALDFMRKQYYLLKWNYDTDYDKLLVAYELAVTKGFSDAARSLGYIYQTGLYVQIDSVRSFKYFKMAADLGCEYSQHYIGNCYLHGNIVSPNLSEGIRYLILALESEGITTSQNDEGLLLLLAEVLV